MYITLINEYLFQAIVAYPPTKVLTSEEQDLLWKFRFYLSSQKKVTVYTFKS